MGTYSFYFTFQNTLQLLPGLNVLFKNGAYRWLIDTKGPLIYSSASFEFARMKERSIFGIIGFKRMNRTCDFCAVILWMYFKRIQQWGLIMVPQVQILLFFEVWCSWKKNITSRFHLFPFKNVSLIRDKDNISLLFRCVLQAWEWAFKRDFSFSFACETLYLVNYNAINLPVAARKAVTCLRSHLNKFAFVCELEVDLKA